MEIREQIKVDQYAVNMNAAAATQSRYRVQISQKGEDAAWDAFLAQTPEGHHVQSSAWAQVKASLGWRPVRIIITQADNIVAGAQVLMRPLPLIGAIGYVSKGPVIALDDPGLTTLVINQLKKLARKFRIQHLTLQPPGGNGHLVQGLSEQGFRPSTAELAPPATLLLDLSKDQDALEAEMNRKTRYNVRLSGRKGITVRDGDESDLVTYYKILASTGERQNFSPYPEKYFTEMWRILKPRGWIKLFLAEFENEVVSAQLAVPFGDTMINKLSVWSGQHGSRRPNEALQWAAITWAKSQGYRFYDFEGIKPAAARAVLRQEAIPESLKQSVTSFKLGFGGEVTIFPEAYDYVYNPLLRWAYTEIFPRLEDRRMVKRILKRIRTQQR